MFTSPKMSDLSYTRTPMSQGAVWYDVNRGCWRQNKLCLLYSTAMFKHTHVARETEKQRSTTGTASASAATTEREHTPMQTGHYIKIGVKHRFKWRAAR